MIYCHTYYFNWTYSQMLILQYTAYTAHTCGNRDRFSLLLPTQKLLFKICEWHIHKHTTSLTHTQLQHNHISPVFCFGFVDVLSGPESGPLWTTRITHDMRAFSGSVDRCTLTGLNLMSCMHAHKLTYTHYHRKVYSHRHTQPHYVGLIKAETSWTQKPFVNWDITQTWLTLVS